MRSTCERSSSGRNNLLVLVRDTDTSLEEKVRLSRVGFDRVIGQIRDLAEALGERPELGETSSRLTIQQLAQLLDTTPVQLVDVRSPSETAEGTLPGARQLPLALIVDLLGGFTAWSNAGLPVRDDRHPASSPATP